MTGAGAARQPPSLTANLRREHGKLPVDVHHSSFRKVGVRRSDDQRVMDGQGGAFRSYTAEQDVRHNIAIRGHQVNGGLAKELIRLQTSERLAIINGAIKGLAGPWPADGHGQPAQAPPLCRHRAFRTGAVPGSLAASTVAENRVFWAFRAVLGCYDVATQSENGPTYDNVPSAMSLTRHLDPRARMICSDERLICTLQAMEIIASGMAFTAAGGRKCHW